MMTWIPPRLAYVIQRFAISRVNLVIVNRINSPSDAVIWFWKLISVLEIGNRALMGIVLLRS